MPNPLLFVGKGAALTAAARAADKANGGGGPFRRLGEGRGAALREAWPVEALHTVPAARRAAAGDAEELFAYARPPTSKAKREAGERAPCSTRSGLTRPKRRGRGRRRSRRRRRRRARQSCERRTDGCATSVSGAEDDPERDQAGHPGKCCTHVLKYPTYLLTYFLPYSWIRAKSFQTIPSCPCARSWPPWLPLLLSYPLST